MDSGVVAEHDGQDVDVPVIFIQEVEPALLPLDGEPLLQEPMEALNLSVENFFRIPSRRQVTAITALVNRGSFTNRVATYRVNRFIIVKMYRFPEV